MTAEQHTRRLRTLLKELTDEISSSASECEPVPLDGTMGRISRGDAMQAQQLALEIKRRREERVARVRSALLRIEQGTYGLCLRCEEPISAGRLKAMPEVLLCVDCAAKSQKR